VPGCVHERRYIHTRTHRQTTQKHNAHVLGGYGIITPVNMAFAGNVNSVAQLFKCCIFCINFSQLSLSLHTVKPFDLAARKVGEFTCKFILASFIVENPNYRGPTLKLEINFLH